MLIDRDQSLLLVVDIQERLAPAMDRPDEVVRNAATLMKAAAEVAVPTVVSEQYPKGLGPTVPELAGLATAGNVYDKLEFSCHRNAGLAERLDKDARDQIVIAGMEAHVCVLQTALDLAEAGKSVFVVADAVGSRRPESRDIALRRMEAAGITAVTTEMVVFEWLRTAAAPAFKPLSKLIR
jgi:nicotinamidase-related amidase